MDPEVEEAFRAVAKKDLTVFLKLRAEELTDDGFGLYLMVSDQSKGRSDSSFTRATPRCRIFLQIRLVKLNFDTEGVDGRSDKKGGNW